MAMAPLVFPRVILMQYYVIKIRSKLAPLAVIKSPLGKMRQPNHLQHFLDSHRYLGIYTAMKF